MASRLATDLGCSNRVSSCLVIVLIPLLLTCWGPLDHQELQPRPSSSFSFPWMPLKLGISSSSFRPLTFDRVLGTP